ncbi:MAG: formyltransferase family protein [Sulfurimonas sp.]|nr:formyltransferase family protein [Sulfurimonas sp.]MDD3060585.1 formyltransferase family protein [Sulfurimonas sp.]MDD5201640.1 formyltransferase family protein [Sulfurimonas sp.]
MRNVAILASHNGSGFNALYEAQHKGILDININLIISNNTNAAVLQNAAKRNIDNFLINTKTQTNPDEAIYDLLKKYTCEFIFLSGYMKKLPAKITQEFKVLNSHPALLPNYGGAGMYGRYVHEAVIQNKEQKSGVTFHAVNEMYDDGEIILQKELVLVENETVDTLEEKIKALEAIAIIEGFALCLK